MYNDSNKRTSQGGGAESMCECAAPPQGVTPTWQDYYVVKRILFRDGLEYLRLFGSWGIFYSDNHEDAGKVAYQIYYRNKKLAERGAERLYRREFGALETAITGENNNFSPNKKTW